MTALSFFVWKTLQWSAVKELLPWSTLSKNWSDWSGKRERRRSELFQSVQKHTLQSSLQYVAIISIPFPILSLNFNQHNQLRPCWSNCVLLLKCQLLKLKFQTGYGSMAAPWTNFCNCLRGWAYSAKSITFASLSQNSINMYKMYDGSELLFLWIPKEARCRWSNVTPPGNDHAGCLSIIAVCITCAPRGCAVIEQNFRSRDIHQGKSTRGWATSRSWSHFILVSWSRTMEKDHKMDQHGITKPYKAWAPCFCREDIACGIDRNGKDVKIVNLQQTLLKCAAHGISNAALSCLDRILYFEVWHHQSSIFQQI